MASRAGMSHFSFRGAMTQYRFHCYEGPHLMQIWVGARTSEAAIRFCPIYNASDYLSAMSGVRPNPFSLYKLRGFVCGWRSL